MSDYTNYTNSFVFSEHRAITCYHSTKMGNKATSSLLTREESQFSKKEGGGVLTAACCCGGNEERVLVLNPAVLNLSADLDGDRHKSLVSL